MEYSSNVCLEPAWAGRSHGPTSGKYSESYLYSQAQSLIKNEEVDLRTVLYTGTGADLKVNKPVNVV